MNKLHLPDYDLKSILLGGQAFNFDYVDGYYRGFTQDKIIKLKQENGNIFWQTYPGEDNFNFLKTYLRLDADYKSILKKIKKDDYIKSAIKKYPDLRLLKQDFEQTLLSFLITPNNNIKSIRKIVRMMCRKFGEKKKVKSNEVFLFPKTEVIANAKLEDLLECKLGFRAKYLKQAAKNLLESNLTKEIKKLNESDARENLKKIKGIGDKIADCILVFGLGFDNVTPLDVWGKRFCTRFYKLNPKMRYDDMRTWLSDYFEGYAAWAGQFLYEYIRNEKIN